jgi:hypothetical protein
MTTSGEPEPYFSLAGAIRFALKVNGFGRTDEWARERVMAASQRVIEAALIEAVPAGYAKIRDVDDNDFVESSRCHIQSTEFASLISMATCSSKSRGPGCCEPRPRMRSAMQWAPLESR